VNIRKINHVSKPKSFFKKKHLILLAFVAPALIFYFIFMVIPLISGAYYSLTDWNALNRTYSFIGIKNFVEAFKDDIYFKDAMFFTFKFAIFVVILQGVLGLLLALIIDSKKKSSGFFRTIFFMPNLISPIIASFVWSFIFQKVFPQAATALRLKFLDQSWLGDPNIAFFSVLFVTLWVGVGYMMIIYLSALQGVPQELKEAAVLDGASATQTFFNVTLPMIMPAITICTFLSINSSLKAFDVFYALTNGGPVRATTNMGLNIYTEAWKGNMRFGYGTAKGMILFGMVLVITIVQLSIMKSKEVQG
jgi:raffinose/stachyose/melibiose transport system permease protein